MRGGRGLFKTVGSRDAGVERTGRYFTARLKKATPSSACVSGESWLAVELYGCEV